ncbi:MAG: hypothetical protein LUC43_01335 [Burkholderiales bacterium]|nr:hypothetical protein [Burkholderiales bacterium]
MRETTKQKLRQLSQRWFDYITKHPELAPLIGRPRLDAEQQFCLQEMPELADELASFEDLRQMDVCLCAYAMRKKEDDPDYLPYLDYKPIHFNLVKPLEEILQAEIKPIAPLETPLERFDEELATMYLNSAATLRKLEAIAVGGDAFPYGLATYRAELEAIDLVMRKFHGQNSSKLADARMEGAPYWGEESEVEYLIRYAEILLLGIEWLKEQRDKVYFPRTLVKF